MKKKPTVLLIMDGLGIPKDCARSGVLENNTKNLQKLAKEYPSTTLQASEEFVGLPKGTAGTSDVGHLTMGAGRTIYQPLVLINRAIKDGSFFENKELIKAMENAKKPGRALHLMGIPTDGSVHTHISHLFACMKLAKDSGIKNVYIHCFTDGRDTPPKSAKKYIKQLEKKIKELGVGEIATIIGRVYAMDRDKNYDTRNKLAYDAMVSGIGVYESNALKAIDNAYARGETDEFIKPIILTKNNKPIATIKKNDSVINYAYRADRSRQLAYVFVEKNDLPWVKDLNLYFVGMMEYDNTFNNTKAAFKQTTSKNILGEVISREGLSQARIAETEKYAYVTFNFNSGKQSPYELEDRFLIASPKLLSFADKPEMSAYEVRDKAIEIISSGKYDFVVINFANGDMVGHSGNKQAAMRAVEVVDECVQQVVNSTLKAKGRIIVTADHGNSDVMEDKDGTPNTAHSLNIVPLIYIDENNKKAVLRKDGTLADIAPTILKLMNIKIPKEMTGKSLIQ